MSNRIFFGATLILLALGACKRSGHSPAPGPVRASESPRTTAMNKRVFAADGMCSDKLVEHYVEHMRLYRGIKATLDQRLAEYKSARANVGYSFYSPNPAKEARAAERLKQTFGFWRDFSTPFNMRYGTFWCLRREDMTILSSAEMEKGIDEIWATVKHLGELPPEQHFELKE
jgi:hypothetical protein